MSTSIPLISSPVSEPWTAWILLLLLVLGGLANVLQPGVIWTSFATLFSKPERQYTDTQETVLGQICLHLFQVGTLSMACYLLCYRTGDFSIIRYGFITLLIIALYLLKVFTMWLVNYTFQLQKQCATIWMHYENLVCAFCCVLYLLSLMMYNAGSTRFLQVMLFLVTGVFVLLVLIKYCRAYLLEYGHLVYILLFLFTVDVLPLLGAYYGANYILSQSF